MKEAAKITFFFGLISLIALGSFCVGMEYQKLRPEPFPSIREWQEKIGCEKIDGKLGPCYRDSEVQAKWGIRYYQVHDILMY